MKVEEFKNIKWNLYDKNPIISPPFYSPIIADPAFLFSEETPDSMFRLYSHSIIGIHEYISKDGIDWTHNKLLIKNAMRANIYKEDGIYYLLYEKYRPFHLIFAWAKVYKWYSEIEMVSSKDLIHWSEPRILLKPELNWHVKEGLGASIGNPCLIKYHDLYYLFYSASLVQIDDCGFNEPEHIGVAASNSISGKFESYPTPLLSPDKKTPYRNLSAGSIKVIAMEDGLVGLENGIYIDKEGKSRSAIYLLDSKEIFHWNYLKSEPILSPIDNTWMNSHVYAFDAKYRAIDNQIYLYFNARDDWHWTKGKEKIGLLKGSN
jgi:hypothetical protein